MPFTLSHAAAVLPAVRRTGRARGPLVASALVLGSFAPDTFFFADAVLPGPLMSYGTFTHSLLGVATADAVLTAVLAACWLLLREPLTALLPRGLRGRVYAFVRGEDWRGRARPALALWFYLSAVAGSLTHVVWDSFTHHDRWGTDAVPELGRTAAFGLPLYSLLQYGTSAMAACALVWFAVSALRRLPATPAPPSVPVLRPAQVWGALALLGVCVAVGVTVRVVRFFTFFEEIRTPFDIIPTVCFGAGGGFVVGLLLYGVLVRLLHRPGRDRRDRHHPDQETRTPVPTA
ncbi:DUF4184 family protein [Streptomyces sp. NBC_00249]|uniref:DUF4184 family protein n=1 Tax=Streptomyces sp. NBC_00249 TaxID=2975690 RepID=UPI002256B4E6|nr:DUF4184 family protein [Streptomyces sp. NBC_00249]MCX5196644.1 DUF4184 family protein [Streptomyces sp. NBC_00249]